MNDSARALRIQLLIAFMCVAMLAYFVLLGRMAIAMIASGRPAAVGLGLAVLIMPVIGLWAMVATLRAGFAHQKLARLIAADGMELDTSALPRRPSGRIERDAADALFATVRTEVEGDPDDWRRWYRLARAYDYAGDRRRAREAMKTAVSSCRADREQDAADRAPHAVAALRRRCSRRCSPAPPTPRSRASRWSGGRR